MSNNDEDSPVFIAIAVIVIAAAIWWGNTKSAECEKAGGIWIARSYACVKKDSVIDLSSPQSPERKPE